MNLMIDHEMFNKLLTKSSRLSLALGQVLVSLSATLNQINITRDMSEESIRIIYNQLRDAHHQAAIQCHELYYRDEL